MRSVSKVRIGWDGPLEIDIRMHLPELASAMQEGYDQSGMKQKTGRLRRALGTLGNYKTLYKGKRVKINIPLPYAAIHDQGGQIPDRRPKTAGAMHFNAYGKEWFLKFAKGYRVKPKNYIARGFQELMTRKGESSGITAQWAEKRNG